MSIAEQAPPVAPNLSPALKGGLAGLAAVAMWAGYIAFARAGVKAGLTPQDFVFLRYATAGVIMLPWLLRNKPKALAGVGWGRGAILALLAGPIFIFLGVGGYVFAPLSHGAVIQPSTITLGSMFAAALLLGERLTKSKLIGVGVIVAGIVAIASAKGGAVGPQTWIGDLLFIGAGLLWVAFTLLLKRWSLSGLQATAAVSILSAFVVIPAFAGFASFERILALSPTMLVTQIIVQGVLSGVLAVVAFGISVQNLGASKAALFPALVPAAALLIGIPTTGEVPSLLEIAGAGLASIGLMIAMGIFGRPNPNK
jgi:drug/metabolite transporter (DMT)-like permease